MMVTVAKSLDVPIKLMFPRPGSPEEAGAPPSHAMLGLGDVVLPGIVIGLALRFDLYLFYLRRQKLIPGPTSEDAHVVEKPKYHSLAGKWSDHFWSHSFTGRPLWTNTTEAEVATHAPFTFPKTYFKASLVGYVLGLLTTLGVMMIWNHAQPALLYLVPGVLGSLWLTALVRGELDLMWNYTEEIVDEPLTEKEQDKTDANKLNMDTQKVTQKSKPVTSSASDASLQIHAEHDTPLYRKRTSRDRVFFSFSIEAPWLLKRHHSAATSAQSTETERFHGVNSDRHNWAPAKIVSPVAETEPAGKRVRLK